MSFPPDRILLGPGPSEVHPAVSRAMAAPMLGHLDPDFTPLLDEIADGLRAAFRTANRVTFAVSGTGSAGMEAVLVNLLEPGDTAVIGVNGVFGGRMAEVARRCGAQVHVVEAPWGEPIPEAEFVAAVEQHRPTVAALVHAETSTGVLQPVAEIGAALAGTDTFFVLDCVTSLAGVEVDLDGWSVDAAYSGTQKCLSVPPGLAPVTFSDRAVERIGARRTPVQSWYLDVNLLLGYLDSTGGRTYHHTAPVSMLYALHAGLELLREEGLAARIDRHRRLGAMLHDGLRALGLPLLAREGHRLPQLTTVGVPDDPALRKWLLAEYGIEVGGGLGEYAGRAIRIGLMGQSCQERNVRLLLAALESFLRD
jgi:alanine-glyoxylate transaminase / serine-glyoxylate transaminase / serine-pyruvate transaminase